MNAKAIPGAINVVSYHFIEGTHVIESDCEDFDHYKRLPAAVEYMGKTLTKTGWNSDRRIVCYQSGRPFAKAV